MSLAKEDLLACIDVGSGYLRMVVAERQGASLRVLDALRRPLRLGRDVYAEGRVSFETLAEACDILAGFLRACRDYGVTKPVALATSAIREAANRDVVLDRIHIATGLSVQVLSNAQERLYPLIALPAYLSGFDKMRREGVLVADVGYGGVQTSYIRHDEMVYSRYERLGVLRLWEMAQRARRQGRRALIMLDEHIRAATSQLHAMQLQGMQHGVMLFGDTDALMKLCGCTGSELSREAVERTWKRLHDTSAEELMRASGVPEQNDEIVLPAVMLAHALFGITSLKALHVPNVSLCEGVLARAAQPRAAAEAELSEIRSYTRHQLRAFRVEEKHVRAVSDVALSMFDGLQRLHRLTQRDRLLLELACQLHEAGHYIASLDTPEQSARIVEASPPLGLSDEETAVVAFLCRYHGAEHPADTAPLQAQYCVPALKLLSFLRAADALDAAHLQKFSDLRVEVQEGHLLLRAASSQDTLLEEMTFAQKCGLLADVFGLQPDLRVKRVENA